MVSRQYHTDRLNYHTGLTVVAARVTTALPGGKPLLPGVLRLLTFDAKWLAQFDWLTALDDPQVTDVQDLIKAARSLPPDKQVELLQGLVQSLAQVLSPLAPASAEFWAHRSIEDLIRQQKVTAVHDIGALAMADWPDDESADDFIAYINAQCH